MTSLFHATFDGDEPPDTLEFVQINGAYSLSNGRLHLPAQTGIPGNGALGFHSVEAFPRALGRIARLRMRFTAFPSTGGMFPFVLARNPTVAFPASANIAHGFSLGSDGALKTSSNGISQGQVASLVLNEDYDFLIVPRAQGAYLLAHEAAAAKYRLLWVSDKDDSADLWLAQSNTTAQGEIESITLDTVDDAKLLSPYGLATFHSATPVDGEIGTMDADGFVEFTWKVGAGEVLELQFRRVDDDNTLLVRCKEALNGVELIKRADGVEAMLMLVGNTFNPGASQRIVVIARHRTRTSEEYQVHVNNKRLIFKTPEDVFNYTATGMKVSGFAVGSDFASYPLLHDDPYADSALPSRYFLAFGDSKTVGSQDASLLPYGSAGTPAYLEKLLSETTGETWREHTPRMGYGGTSTAEQVPLIAAELAAAGSLSAVEHILYALGANDMSKHLNETIWKADTRTLWRALHSAAPNAALHVAYPYSQIGAWNTSPDTYAGWLDAVRSEAEFSYVLAGVDERVVLGFDGGVTKMADPKHPNHAGYVDLAPAWMERLLP